MGTKIEVLGVKLDVFSVKEAMRHVEEYLSNDVLNIVGMVSTASLMASEGDTHLKSHIEQLDMSMIVDTLILDAAGIGNKWSYKEVESNAFFTAFLRYVVQHGTSLFILGETGADVCQIQDHLRGSYRNLTIAGSCAFADYPEDEDIIVNEINSVSPDVILASAQVSCQDAFLCRNRQKLNAKLWLAMGKYNNVAGNMGLKMNSLSRLIHNRMFRRVVTKYENEKDED